MTNEEVFACQYLVHIPANDEFSSLNLAQAVQVVAYELFIASGGTLPPLIMIGCGMHDGVPAGELGEPGMEGIPGSGGVIVGSTPGGQP